MRLKIAGLILLLMTLLIGIFLWRADRHLRERLDAGWFLPPIEFYSAPLTIEPQGRLNISETLARLKGWGWRERHLGQPLHRQDFVLLDRDNCLAAFPEAAWPQVPFRCLGVWPGHLAEPWWAAIDENRVIAIYGSDGRTLDRASLPPELFAQFYEDQPILRTVVGLGEIPLACAQAVTAIEDSEFLEHKGISPTAIARAFIRNLKQARFAEGGSTITQQLVKNYFLTSEKTLSRKIHEQILSILLELRVDKDTILANYLNVIYMGQHGSFQVRGFAAAAQHYFERPLRDLDLPECALLAAIINNPGRYNPNRQSERALQRRNLVLSRMQELNMISPDQAKAASEAPLGARTSRFLSEPAPYFVQAVREKVKEMGLKEDSGLRIYTTLNPTIQERTQVLVAQEIERIENGIIKQNSKAPPLGTLQGAAIVADVESGGVLGFVGGRQFKQTQFNRITSARRQPGSLFKPFVFLAALESEDFQPESQIEDAPWSLKYQGQTWTPQNYDRTFMGPVSMAQALALSLNVPTAKLAQEVGLESVIELAHRLGIEAQMQALPSLALGAMETSPWEVAQAYLTIARHGELTPLHMISSITDHDGHELYILDRTSRTVVRKDFVDELIEMMKGTFVFGTAKSLAGKIKDEPAGKTGTTSDTRDCWFAGFNERQLALTWVGYDDNTPTGRTGASAALPLWYKIIYP